MIEKTIVYAAEITEIIREPEMDNSPEALEEFLKDTLQADDVHVKSVKVFPREVAE